jgi:hypothetical protein
VTLYERVADLPVAIADWSLEHREADTSSGFTRVTTTVSFEGPDGEVGRGEDVTYDADEHDALHEGAAFEFAGEYTLDEFAGVLDETELFPAGEPKRAAFEHYRRWGFESAALDLALRQADTSLGAALGREYDPVRFVVSTRLSQQDHEGGAAGDPEDGGPDESDLPTSQRVWEWLDLDSDLEFKLDPTPEWTRGLVEELSSTGAVRILDLKGLYEDETVGVEPEQSLYRLAVDEFPDVILEDPALTDDTRPLFDGAEDRVAWDVPVKDVESVESLPWDPSWLNVKPSRFGTVESLLDTIDYCEDRGIRLYGGGQFELGVGREHVQALASVFYPASPNDVAPIGYNAPEPQADLPSSPLEPPGDPRGLGFDGG